MLIDDDLPVKNA